MANETTKHFVDLGTCDVIIRGVPCHKCVQCGEVAFNLGVGKRLEQIIDTVKGSLSEIAVIQYTNEAA